jgi:glutamate transport system ATP-binding protein
MRAGGARQRKRSEAESLVVLRGVSKRHGMLQSLGGIDLDLPPGEIVAVLGPSGAGKSTLCRAINGQERIDSGSVTVAGTQLPRHGRRSARMRPDIGLVGGQSDLAGHLTVLQNVVAGRFGLWTRLRHGLAASSPAAVERRAVALLERLGIAELADRYPWELSDGLQRQVAIARALVTSPRLMLFDEPTLALAPDEAAEVLASIRGLADDGLTVLVVTGEIDFVRAAAHRVVFMSGGRIVEQGPPAEFFTMPRTARARDFLAGGPRSRGV